jgi:hypothetical protein
MGGAGDDVIDVSTGTGYDSSNLGPGTDVYIGSPYTDARETTTPSPPTTSSATWSTAVQARTPAASTTEMRGSAASASARATRSGC